MQCQREEDTEGEELHVARGGGDGKGCYQAGVDDCIRGAISHPLREYVGDVGSLYVCDKLTIGRHVPLFAPISLTNLTRVIGTTQGVSESS